MYPGPCKGAAPDMLLYLRHPCKPPGYILVKHIIPLFGDFLLNWTLKILPNIFPRCDKSSEFIYISQTIPLRMENVTNWKVKVKRTLRT